MEKMDIEEMKDLVLTYVIKEYIEDDDAIIDALGLTTNVIVCVPMHVPLSPVTVYMVVDNGESVIELPLTLKGLQV